MVVRRLVAGVLCAVAVAACGERRPTAKPGVSGPELSAASRARARELGLTRTLPPAYRRVCEEQAADAPAGARACPPLVPAGGFEVIDADPFGPAPRRGGGYVADLASPSLSELGGTRIETNGGHWHYDVSWTADARRLLVRRGVQRPPNATRASTCRVVRLIGERAERCRVVPHEQGGGLNGGHTAYVWRDGPVTYVVSLHGYANEPRAAAMTEALIALVVREGHPAH